MILILVPHDQPMSKLSRLADWAFAKGPIVSLAVSVAGAAAIGSVILTLMLTKEFGALAPFAMLIGVPVAAIGLSIGSVLLGLPYSWILYILKIEGPWSYGVGGFLLGSFMLLSGTPTYMDLIFKGAGGIYGGICALLWWRIYRSNKLVRSNNPALEGE